MANLKFIIIYFALCVGALMVSPFYSVAEWGIMPRNFIGLRGILFAPFLHANLNHFLGNAISFAIFAITFQITQRGSIFFPFLFFTLLGGFGTWLIGKSGVHIGASGVVFAFYSYFIFLGYFRKRLLDILLSFVLLAGYSGILWGLLPGYAHISWESHLCGFISGFLLAKRRKN